MDNIVLHSLQELPQSKLSQLVTVPRMRSRQPPTPSIASADHQDLHSRWPPSPLPPYPTAYPPIPSFENRHEWIYFINGYSRRKVRVTDPEDPRIRSQKAFSPSRPVSAPAVTAELEQNEEDVMNGDADEEEEMNAAPPIYDVEEESERHRPREPTVAILCRLDNVSTRQHYQLLVLMSSDKSSQFSSKSPSISLGRLTNFQLVSTSLLHPVRHQ